MRHTFFSENIFPNRIAPSVPYRCTHEHQYPAKQYQKYGNRFYNYEQSSPPPSAVAVSRFENQGHDHREKAQMKHPLVKPPNQMSVFVQQQPANAEKQKEQHRRQTGPERDFAAHTAPFT